MLRIKIRFRKQQECLERPNKIEAYQAHQNSIQHSRRKRYLQLGEQEKVTRRERYEEWADKERKHDLHDMHLTHLRKNRLACSGTSQTLTNKR